MVMASTKDEPVEDTAKAEVLELQKRVLNPELLKFSMLTAESR